MTPKPESETDPPPVPNIIAALEAGTATPELISEWASHPYVCTTDIIRRAIAALLAARAAEAAQYQQEIAAKDAQIQDLQSGRWRTYRNSCPRTFTDIPMTPDECSCVDCVEIRNARELVQLRAAISTIDAQIHQQAELLAQRWDTIERLSHRLAAVEAERDKAQRALATAYLKARRQASVCEPNEDQFAGAMAVVAAAFPNTRVEATAVRIAKPEEPTELVVAVKRRAERAEAERDRLKAALSKITALDFEKFNGRHNFYSGAVMFVKAWLLAYAALAPHQGQSTDGETR